MFTNYNINKVIRNLSQPTFLSKDIELEKQCQDYQYKCGKVKTRKVTKAERQRFDVILAKCKVAGGQNNVCVLQ